MPLVLADRVRETSTTTGTGTLTLAGAVAGFRTFSAGVGNTNTCYYTITMGSDWEVGVGTVGAGTLTRDTILSSSNSGSAVNFAAGTKDVFATYPAGRSVTTTEPLTNKPIDSSTIGGTTPAAGTFTTLTGNSTSQFGRSSANYFQAIGAAANASPEISVLGSDTNIPFTIESKGTGAINFAAGSRGVNVSNGGTVTNITRTAGGTGYTSAPTVTISAPTTAGGVQATATCTITGGVVDSAITITNAGSGYVEQPTVTFSGGGGSGAAAYASVGATTTIKGLFGGNSAIPVQLSGPSGALLQVMESGTTSSPVALVVKAGGSAAQLYPSVSNTSMQISSAGTGVINFYTSTLSAEQLRVSHTASAVNYVQVTGAATTGIPTISAQGSDSGVTLGLASKGGNTVSFYTNSNQRQAAVLHTAGTIANYATFTGNVAGSAPIFGVAGSDTNIDLTLTPKGTGKIVVTGGIRGGTF